jgi:hypothetical protein
MDQIMDTRTVMFIGDYFSMMVTVGVPEEDVKDGEVYEDACLRVAGALMKEHYGWDVVAVSNHIGVLDEGDPNCETCYGAGKMKADVGGVTRDVECPDCFNSQGVKK